MRQTRFQIAKKDIIATFEEYNNNIFSYKDISEILAKNRRFWRLPLNLTTNDFIALLINAKKLKRYTLNFPSGTTSRFVWGETSPFSLALNLKTDSYFTHYTACFWHNLTDQIPKTIYVNQEQSQKKAGKVQLLQDAIDRAFAKPLRTSSNIAAFGDYKICLLNGKFTGKTGVTEMTTPETGKMMVTDLESLMHIRKRLEKCQLISYPLCSRN